jgi:hypothetical protein
MPGPAATLAPGVQETGNGGRGLVALGPNTRVRGVLGRWITQADTVLFPTGTGNWALGATRVRVVGVPAVNQTSFGVAALAVLPFSGTVLVVQGDSRIRRTL